MRAVVQRVSRASVITEGREVSSIGMGLLVLLGFHVDDDGTDSDYIRNKILGLRIFDDSEGVMNLSVQDISGEVLLVSQFTLYADTRKGRRPSYSIAMPPGRAGEFYEDFVKGFSDAFPAVKTGIFGARMEVSLVNEGPVTIIMESRGD